MFVNYLNPYINQPTQIANQTKTKLWVLTEGQ